MFSRIIVPIAVVVVVILLLSRAGSFLVLNAPERSDAILILGAADDSPYRHALRLQQQRYGGRILLDASANRTLFGESEADLAAGFLNRTSPGIAQVCPTFHDSTFGEAEDVKRCLERLNISSVLLVASDFHTRTALSILRKRLPQYRWSVAAASAPYHDADQWWKHRAWAKTVLDEWNQYLWWQLIDRWRSGVVLS